ncbi:MAG: hypothetical protein ACREPQ_14555 [Rhodanobacter sp.]
MYDLGIHRALEAHNRQTSTDQSLVQRTYRWIECQVKSRGLDAGIRLAENTQDGFGPYGGFAAARQAATNFLARYA